MGKTIFVSGIDTDAGKSYCTGFWANLLAAQGKSVITQKFIQTGNSGLSEDIELHRRIMGIPLQPVDIDRTTAPLIFHHPCSPQLAARLDNREIDLEVIDRASQTLSELYDIVLLEGAGGLMVPISDDFFTIDYVATRNLPLALTIHSGLGSINHIILSLMAIKEKGIDLRYILYNHHFDTDPFIAEDTCNFIRRYLAKHFPGVEIIDVPSVKLP